MGFWTVLGLFLAASCHPACGAPLVPEAQGTFPPGALGCGAQQDGQAQVQATGGLEAGLSQSWSQECPSVPRLASAPVPATEATAAEGEGERVATIAGGDSTQLVKSGPETAAREEEVVERHDGIQEGLVQEEAGEEEEQEARGQATLTTTTITTTATSKASTSSAMLQSSAEERQRGSVPVTSVPSGAAEKKQVSWLKNGHSDAAEPGDLVAKEEEEGEGEGVALLHTASLTASPATDGQRSRAAADAAADATAFATVPPSAKLAMPMATPPSGGPSGRKTDGWGVAQMAQQSGDPAQAGGQAERGQQSGSTTLTPDMTRGATPEGHVGGGYDGRVWEAAVTQAPQGALTSPNSESGRGLAATAASVTGAGAEHTQLLSDDSQEDLHPSDGTVVWTAESSVLLRSGETGAGAISPVSGPSWASQLPPLIPRSDAPLAETWSVAAGLQGGEFVSLCHLLFVIS